MGKSRGTFCGGVFFLVLSSILAAAWTTKRLTVKAGDSTTPAVATSWPNVYVVWSDDTPGNKEIYFKKSIDGGSTWQTAKRLTNNSDDSVLPDITVVGSNIYVVWNDYTPGNEGILFKKSTDKGGTWGNVVKLSDSSGGYSPRIARGGSTLYVVWCARFPTTAEIFFRQSADGGATWQPLKRLTYNAGDSYWPVVASDGVGNIYVVWEDDTAVSGCDDVFIKKSTDGGATWQANKKLWTGHSNHSRPAIVISDADVYVAWDDYGDIYMKKSSDNGSSWGKARKLTNNYGNSEFPSLAAYEANVFAVWHDDAPGNCEIFFRQSSDNGATWGAAEKLTANSGASYCPRIKFAFSGLRKYVTWYDNTPGNYEVYFGYSPL